jgi:O-antigen/teichoic acid export membrane protein
MAEIVSYVSNAAATVAFPRFAEVQRDAAYTARIVRATFAAAVFTAVIAGVFGTIAIPVIFGQRFADSVGPFLLLLPGTASLAIVKMLSAVFVGSGQPGKMTSAAIVALVLTVFLDFALIPGLGAAGAAIASTCAYVAGAATCIWLYRRTSSASLKQLLVLRTDDLRVLVAHRAPGRN